MSSPADAIPSLERLMRDVIRLAMEADHGPGWLATLSSGAREAVDHAAGTAKRNRPIEVLRDEWEAVGLDEIAAVLRSPWPSAMFQVWDNKSAASVDLKRLSDYRGKNLHAVGPPSGQVSDDEIGATIRRLQIGFEAVRRKLLDDNGEWWPYIASVHSNIPEFLYERSSGGMHCSALLNEGDLVTLDAVGVNPTGDDSQLLYRLMSSSVPEAGRGDWTPSPSFSFTVPCVPVVTAHLVVADHPIADMMPLLSRAVAFSINVRPLGR